MMKTNNHLNFTGMLLVLLLGLEACKAPQVVLKEANSVFPAQFTPAMADNMDSSQVDWRTYFNDDYLNALIDSSLRNNQEFNILLQEIEISRNEVLERSGDYQPMVRIGGGAGAEKPGRFTRDGAVEHSLEIDEGKAFPEPLGDFILGANASWEVDIWRKLRNARDAAQFRYMAQTEGKNLLITVLISEIAEAYYELMALDNLQVIINQNVVIQRDALEKVRQLKEFAQANQLAVNRFEAQLLNTQNQQYTIRQRMIETENRIRFLVGVYSEDIPRHSENLMGISVDSLRAGIPSQLLDNRPDIRKAALEMEAAKLDVQSARASFFPQLDLRAGIGFQAFNPGFLFNPESLVFNAAGDLMAPVINRKAIQARFNMATAFQIQSVFAYEQTLLQAYTDVLNQMNKLENFSQGLDIKSREVEVLVESVDVANNLFQFAKADYVEVLLTQEEVLDAQMELVETKLKQLQAKVQLYRALGGGWN